MNIVTYKQFRCHAVRLERANMRARGVSLAASSIMRAAKIFEVRENGKTLIVEAGWRDQMRDAASVR